MNPSFPSSIQSWIPAVPNPFFNLSLQSWILPFLHSSYPDLKVVWKASDRWLSSLMVWEGLKLEKRYTTRIKRYETLIKGSKFEEKVQNLIENMWNYETKRFFLVSQFRETIRNTYFRIFSVSRNDRNSQRNSELFRTVSYFAKLKNKKLSTLHTRGERFSSRSSTH